MKKSCLLFWLFLFTISTSVIAQKQPNEKVDFLNNVLIFDLYINFELTNKNDNLAIVVDYVQNSKKLNNTKVEMKSNMGGEEEIMIVQYNDQSKLSKLEYKVFGDKFTDDRIYKYQFKYDGLLLRQILLGGRLVFGLKYNKKGRLLSISRRVSDDLYYEVYFLYNKTEGAAELRFDVLENGKNKSLDATGYAKWNKKNQLTDYSIYRYDTTKIEYNKKGDILKFNFLDNQSSKSHGKWEYEYNEDDLWIKRTAGDSFMERRFFK